MARRLGAVFVTVILAAAVAPTSALAGADDASVTATATKVDVRSKGARKFAKVSEVKPVRVGDLVRTDATGLAQVDYGDGSYTRLDHDTKFTVKKLTNDAGERQVKTTLVSGQTFNRVEKLSETESFVQSTAGIAAGVLGTTFAVARDQDAETSTFTLIEGTLTLRIRGETEPVQLTAGQRVAVTAGAVGPVQTLTPDALCADAWICANQEAFATEEAPAPTTVPFSFDATGSSPIDASGRTTITGSGSGTAGSFTFVSTGSLTFPIPQCPGASSGTLSTTFTFADGHQLFTSWATTTCQSGSSPLTFSTSGPFTIEGGTGRFEGATGGGNGTGATTVTSGSTTSSSSHFQGTITLQPTA